MGQAEEQNDLAESAGDSTVDDKVALLESFYDFCRWSLGHTQHVETQDALHVHVALGESDQLFKGKCFDNGRFRDPVIHPGT